MKLGTVSRRTADPEGEIEDQGKRHAHDGFLYCGYPDYAQVLVKRMIAAGRLGDRAEKRFYDYEK